MSDEDRLRERLHERAAAVAPMADIDDVAARIQRRGHGRSRTLTVVAVVALVVGTLGGFAVGRAGRDSSPVVAVGTDRASAKTSVDPHSLTAALDRSPMEKLFVRTTPDGIAIRVYRSDKSAILNAELSTDAAVTYAQDGLASDPIGIEMYSAGAFGVREQSPAQWVMVQAGPDIAGVRVRFGDGSSDQMAPDHGVAVLAHRGAASASTIEGLGVDGRVAASESVPTPQCVEPACTPATLVPRSTTATPTLPAPGAPPADLAGARLAVTQAFAGAFDGSASNEEHARAIDGGDKLISVFEELRHGPVGASVNKAKTVVEEIAFVSPTRAAVRFHSQLGPDGGISGPYVGNAILTASGWQMTRDSFCRLALLAGAKCP